VVARCAMPKKEGAQDASRVACMMSRLEIRGRQCGGVYDTVCTVSPRPPPHASTGLGDIQERPPTTCCPCTGRERSYMDVLGSRSLSRRAAGAPHRRFWSDGRVFPIEAMRHGDASPGRLRKQFGWWSGS